MTAVRGARGLRSSLENVAQRAPEGEVVTGVRGMRVIEVEVVTSARRLCSLLVPAVRGALEVEVVTGGRGLCS